MPSFVARLAIEKRVPVAPKHTVKRAIYQLMHHHQVPASDMSTPPTKDDVLPCDPDSSVPDSNRAPDPQVSPTPSISAPSVAAARSASASSAVLQTTVTDRPVGIVPVRQITTIRTRIVNLDMAALVTARQEAQEQVEMARSFLVIFRTVGGVATGVSTYIPVLAAAIRGIVSCLEVVHTIKTAQLRAYRWVSRVQLRSSSRNADPPV